MGLSIDSRFSFAMDRLVPFNEGIGGIAIRCYLVENIINRISK